MWVMKIDLATQGDVLEILTIFKQTAEFFKEQGIDQWQVDYPNISTVLADIAAGQCYIGRNSRLILGVIVLSTAKEASYDELSDGHWNSPDDSYTVIHRLAVNRNYPGKGVSVKLINKAEALTKAKGFAGIRTDTHEANDGMRYILTKQGFRYTGQLTLADGSPRLGYDKLID